MGGLVVLVVLVGEVRPRLRALVRGGAGVAVRWVVAELLAVRQVLVGS